MKYKLVSRVNPQNRTLSKLYAQPVNEGTEIMHNRKYA